MKIYLLKKELRCKKNQVFECESGWRWMSFLHVICGHTSRDNPEPVPGGGAEDTPVLGSAAAKGWVDWKAADQGPHPTPPHAPAPHIPGETVDLLHVEAAGGTVS